MDASKKCPASPLMWIITHQQATRKKLAAVGFPLHAHDTMHFPLDGGVETSHPLVTTLAANNNAEGHLISKRGAGHVSAIEFLANIGFSNQPPNAVFCAGRWGARSP